VRGESRYDNVAQALALIADDVDLEGRRRVLIKPNFVSTSRQLAATHVEAVRAVLDFLRQRYDGPITIGEGAALSDTVEGYIRFGYLELARQYDVRLVDLNRDEWVEVEVLDRQLRPLRVRVSKTVAESDFRIAVGPPKTHDVVIVTLSLKNMAVGSLIRDPASGQELLRRLGHLLPSSLRNSLLVERVKGRLGSRVSRSDKMAIHQGYPAINLNLYRLARLVPPHLAVIDGFEAMEGDGPIYGDPVPWRIAIASADFLAADVLATHLMGFDADEVGYLHYCKIMGLGTGELGQIEVVGNVSPEECRRAFRPHSSYPAQRNWRIPGVEKYL